MFDHGGMSATLEQLRERISALEGGPARLPVPTLPALADLVQLRTGGSYAADSAGLALALAAGASQAGEWIGVIGWPDFGAEGAAALGVDLQRTVLVPDPGEHWVEVVAALVDVMRVVVLRPPAGVDARAAGVLDARLRTRSAVLVVWGEWPRCEVRLALERSRWRGVGSGHGLLRARRVRMTVQRGTAPPVRADLWFPGEQAVLERVETPVVVPESMHA